MSTPVTLTGRLTKAPELKFSNSGSAIARFTVVTDRRQLNKQTNAWENVESTFWDCTAFGALGENCAESLDKGDLVIVTGRAKQENWEDKNTGAKRSAIRVIADEVAPSLRFATAKIQRTQRGDGSGNNGGNQNQGGQPQQSTNSGGWGGQPQGGGSGWGGQNSGGWGSAEEAPF